MTTADTDDRVVPGHSFKFIAELQYCQAGDAPVLARIETRAGHGAGKPTAKHDRGSRRSVGVFGEESAHEIVVWRQLNVRAATVRER